MGHGLSCGRDGDEHDFFRAAQAGDADAMDGLLAGDPSLARRATIYDRLTPLHVAAANGHLEAVSLLLDRGRVRPDVLSRTKQTPLMLAAMHGKLDCVLRLLHAGANILMFDSVHARSCLHHAAYYGHGDCLAAILAAARTAPVAASWGFARFVNVRDEHGATPLHLAARHGRGGCVHQLLDAGAIVSAPTGSYGFPGSTALHLAARGGSLECVRELLAWGADRAQRDSAGRIAYAVAVKRRHGGCAAALDPAAAEPMVWPSPLKLIAELDAGARALLQAALADANKKILTRLKAVNTSVAGLEDDDREEEEEEEEEDEELCSICFEQACSMEVEDCGHRMCAACTLALCCHSKPNPATLTANPPACPFCRTCISRLVVAESKAKAAAVVVAGDELDEKAAAAAGSPRLSRRRSRRSREGSSSFKGLSSAVVGSLSCKIGRGSGRLAGDSNGGFLDKPEHDP